MQAAAAVVAELLGGVARLAADDVALLGVVADDVRAAARHVDVGLPVQRHVVNKGLVLGGRRLLTLLVNTTSVS